MYRRRTSALVPQPSEELRLVAALCAGDEAAFVELLDRFGASMLRISMLYVSSRAVAEEVVQEAWVGVLNGLDRFEGRSSLKTWVFRILTNIAKTRGEREGRIVPFSSLAAADEDTGPAVLPERFQGDEARWPGHWVAFPGSPEEALLGQEARERIAAAIESLPASQRAVITLRDVTGFSAEEVCNVLEITETNQRVLLHRARSRARAALEGYLEES